MIVLPVRTDRIEPNAYSLLDVLDTSISKLDEGSIVVIASKVVALCEGSVVPRGEADRDELIAREATKYLPPRYSRYGHHFTIANHTLIASAGIDESNGANEYVLWPRDPLATAFQAREHLAKRFNLRNVGVIITDSTCQPLRRGTSGIAMAHAGFHGVKSYIGKPDLFGHIYKVTYSNISGGLAAAAVVTMGEGTEQTPVCILSDVPFVEFNATAPDSDELKIIRIESDEDLFAPFLEAVDWLPGEDQATPKS